MIYKEIITKDNARKYTEYLIDRLFEILYVYENCEKTGDFIFYKKYLYRILTETMGCAEMLEIAQVIDTNIIFSIQNILNGMYKEETTCHSNVKSLVFHCISLIKKG